MKSNVKSLLAVSILAVLLQACSSLGLAPPQTVAPQTPGQRLYYYEGIYAAAMQAADNALLAKSITPQQAKGIYQVSDQVDIALATAKAAIKPCEAYTASSGTSPPASSGCNEQQATAQLDALNAAIIQLQSFLATQGVKQ